MRPYEIMVILDPTLDERTVAPSLEAFLNVVRTDGGTVDKPVGTVYLGLYHQNKVIDRVYHFIGSRRQIQEKTAQTALDLVRRALLES